MAIPKIIHQTARSLAGLPPEITANMQKIAELNPSWDCRFYGDDDVLAYIEQHFGERVRRACRQINPRFGVVLADLFRYLVVFREGGVYLDIKSTVNRPLDEVIADDDVYLISQWRNRVGERDPGWGLHPELLRLAGGELQQWHIVAAPRHPFLSRVIDEVLFNMEHYHPGWFGMGKTGIMRTSGPICYSLSIAPLLPFCRHRVVDIEELGFAYSIYGSSGRHMNGSRYYGRFNEPVMLRRRAAGEARSGRDAGGGNDGRSDDGEEVVGGEA